MGRIKDYIVFIFLISSSCAYAQTNNTMLAPITISKIKDNTIAFPKPTPTYNHQVLNLPLLSIATDYYTKNFGFFCKQELKLEKCVKTPIHIRLGDIKYVNWLEQKGSNNYPVN